MFTHAADIGAGIPIEAVPYQEGNAGIVKQSLPTICKKIREGMQTAVMKSFAGNVLKQAGFPDGTANRTQTMLDFVRRNIAYAGDALGTEQIQSAAISLCVEGAPVCIPIGDCDDLVTALGTLLAAIGIEVRVVRQKFGGDQQEHVLLEVRDEGGRWLAADPTSKTMPVGKKARAAEEETCSPWDDQVSGLNATPQFVGIGAIGAVPLPVFMFIGGAWRQVDHLPKPAVEWRDVGGGVQQRVGVGAVNEIDTMLEEQPCCDSCAAGGPCTGCTDETATGFGSIVDDIGAAARFSVDPYALVRQFWAQIQGRSWDDAIASADARAHAGAWTSGDLAAKNDFITLIVSSAINAKQAYARGDTENGDALMRTWAIVARRAGVKQPTPAETQHMMTTAGIELGAVEALIIGLIVAAALAGILVALCYFASDVIDNVLSKIECDRELIRLQAELDKVIQRHQDGSPLSDDEKALRDKVLAQQQFVAGGCIARKPSTDWSLIAVGAGVVGIAVLGVVYAPEIKSLFSTRRRLR